MKSLPILPSTRRPGSMAELNSRYGMDLQDRSTWSSRMEQVPPHGNVSDDSLCPRDEKETPNVWRTRCQRVHR